MNRPLHSVRSLTFILLILNAAFNTAFAADEPEASSTDTDPSLMEFKNREVQLNSIERLLDVQKEIKEQMRALDEREILVVLKEKKIRELEDLVEERVQFLEAKIAELKALDDKIVDQEAERMKRLAQLYSEMKPKKAAAIFDNLGPETLYRISTLMAEKELAPILASMDPQNARILTEIMAHRLEQRRSAGGL